MKVTNGQQKGVVTMIVNNGKTPQKKQAAAIKMEASSVTPTLLSKQ